MLLLFTWHCWFYAFYGQRSCRWNCWCFASFLQSGDIASITIAVTSITLAAACASETINISIRAMFLRVPLRSTTHYFSGTDKDRDGPHVTVPVDAVELLVQKLTPNHRSTASALPRKPWPRVGANSDVLRFVSFLLLALFLPRFSSQDLRPRRCSVRIARIPPSLERLLRTRLFARFLHDRTRPRPECFPVL